MRTISDNIMDRLDDLTSSVEFIKSKMMKDECDQMSKEMKQDQEKWKREEYKGIYANIKKSRQFGEVGCGGGLQYILVPKDVQVIAMWNGKVSNENSNKKDMPDTVFFIVPLHVETYKIGIQDHGGAREGMGGILRWSRQDERKGRGRGRGPTRRRRQSG